MEYSEVEAIISVAFLTLLLGGSAIMGYWLGVNIIDLWGDSLD